MIANCPFSCGECGSGTDEDPGTDPNCVDNREECVGWFNAGECQNNPAFMNVNCQKSCGQC
jgi:hypothetical protein